MTNIIKDEQKETDGSNCAYSPAETATSVKEVFPLQDYWLLLFFANGEIRLYDSAWTLQHSSMEKLHKRSFFKRARVSHDGVKWNKKIAIGAEELYEKSTPLTDYEGNLLKLV